MNIISVIVILIIFAVACFGFFVLGVGVGGALEECKHNKKLLKQNDEIARLGKARLNSKAKTVEYNHKEVITVSNEMEAAQNGKDT